MVLPFRTSNYAVSIYLQGQNRLTSRDTYTGVPTEYYAPVEQYAADKYDSSQLNNALAQGWITKKEYDETIARKPSSPVVGGQ